MIQVFEDGLDPHDLTAMKMLDLRRDEWEALTKEERSQHRKRAKAVNFGRLFGQGAEGLVKAAREQYGVIIDLVTAKAWIETFKRTYPDYTRWCSRFANACQRSRRDPDRPRRRARPRDPLEPGRLPLHAMPQSADPGHLRRHRHAGPGDDRSLALRGGHRRRASRLAARRDRAGSACGRGRQGSPTSSKGDDRGIPRKLAWCTHAGPGRAHHRSNLGRG